ncbi:hypothetical protein M0804_008989 [Polistes exclamans]|nr:hypothetical protein M0804_008989 [Polistes exclamans]
MERSTSLVPYRVTNIKETKRKRKDSIYSGTGAAAATAAVFGLATAVAAIVVAATTATAAFTAVTVGGGAGTVAGIATAWRIQSGTKG